MNSIQPLQFPVLQPATAAEAPAGSPPAGFADALKGALDQVSRAQAESHELSLRFQQEDPAVSLERTMIAMSQANVAFQALVQTRNRLVQAYHDVMNMQV